VGSLKKRRYIFFKLGFFSPKLLSQQPSSGRRRHSRDPLLAVTSACCSPPHRHNSQAMRLLLYSPPLGRMRGLCSPPLGRVSGRMLLLLFLHSRRLLLLFLHSRRPETPTTTDPRRHPRDLTFAPPLVAAASRLPTCAVVKLLCTGLLPAGAHPRPRQAAFPVQLPFVARSGGHAGTPAGKECPRMAGAGT